MAKVDLKKLRENIKKLNDLKIVSRVTFVGVDTSKAANDFCVAIESIDDMGRSDEIPQSIIDFYEKTFVDDEAEEVVEEDESEEDSDDESEEEEESEDESDEEEDEEEDEEDDEEEESDEDEDDEEEEVVVKKPARKTKPVEKPKPEEKPKRKSEIEKPVEKPKRKVAVEEPVKEKAVVKKETVVKKKKTETEKKKISKSLLIYEEWVKQGRKIFGYDVARQIHAALFEDESETKVKTVYSLLYMWCTEINRHKRIPKGHELIDAEYPEYSEIDNGQRRERNKIKRTVLIKSVEERNEDSENALEKRKAKKNKKAK